MDDKSWAVREVGNDEDIPDELICHTAKATKTTAAAARGSQKARGAAAKEKGTA